MKIYKNGHLISNKNTVGTAKELGLQNVDELIGKGKPYTTHFIGTN